MFFDQFTEDARRAIATAKEEAANADSTDIEAEHLLIGIARAIEPDLKEFLRFKEVEDTLRAGLQPNAPLKSRETPVNLLFSNPGKRILAYAAEEANRLNSPGIGSGHLLLGVLRETKSNASTLLTAHNVDLEQVRQIVAKRSGIAGQLPRQLKLTRQLKEKVARSTCTICNRLFEEHSQKEFDD
jgi:ATP-dependent Clp protease ATP-binding subunit ClpC